MTSSPLRPLTNDTWEFESNCFVCEARNEAGLRIPFQHDVDAGVVVAEFELDERFPGAPRFVHGGLVLAVLDEAMAWAAIAIAGRFAVTTATTTNFARPVLLGQRHQVRAWITGTEGRSINIAAEIVRNDGKQCAASHAVFTALDLEQASSAIGTPLAAEAARFTSDTGA